MGNRTYRLQRVFAAYRLDLDKVVVILAISYRNQRETNEISHHLPLMRRGAGGARDRVEASEWARKERRRSPFLRL